MNALRKAVTDVGTTADAFHAASNVSLAPAPKAQIGSGFHGNAGESAHFDAEPKSPGACPVPNFFYWCIASWSKMGDSGI